ncbi:hypothetical protein [Sanguibacter sp. 25GB23B1]|uniref:hypothetical protein n=1 Tax=unclassified Sanguibacter TaxID=2645534 RepID=UPI0032AF4EA5
MATFEIRTSGNLGPVAVPARASWRGLTEVTETVLVLTVGDAPGLERSLGRLADLGLELQSVRRTPERLRASPEPTRMSARGSGATYEVRVLGQVGPVLLHAVPHHSSSSDAHHRTVVTRTPDDMTLVDVLAGVLATGARLESVRLRTQVTTRAPWRPES